MTVRWSLAKHFSWPLPDPKHRASPEGPGGRVRFKAEGLNPPWAFSCALPHLTQV